MSLDQPTSLDVQGAVFSEMLQNWGLDHPKVIAHDFGGATTLRAHLLDGVEFEHLVLLNVVAVRPWGSEFFEHVGKHIDAFIGLPPHIHTAVVDAYIRGALVNPLVDGDLDALIAPWLTESGRVSFYRQFEQADEKYTAEIEADFGNLRCPTTILWGEDDPWIPLSRGLELKNKVKPVRFEVLSGLGHLPQLEGAETTVEMLKRSLVV